jgi:hypothetical protein
MLGYGYLLSPKIEVLHVIFCASIFAGKSVASNNSQHDSTTHKICQGQSIRMNQKSNISLPVQYVLILRLKDLKINGLLQFLVRMAASTPFPTMLAVLEEIGPNLEAMIIASKNVAYSLIMVVFIVLLLIHSNRILEIDTINGTVTALTTETVHGSWASSALAIDGCIYFMPYTYYADIFMFGI